MNNQTRVAFSIVIKVLNTVVGLFKEPFKNIDYVAQ